MSLLNSQMVPLGTPAHDFNLPGVDGKMHSLDGYMEISILVIIFMCNHCPYVKAVLQRLIYLQNQYSHGSVQLIGINSNDAEKYPDDSMENMKKIAAERKIPFPYLFDETQDVARKYDAVCTPDIFVYGMERQLQYRGRIDDNWENPEKVTQNDLLNAINCILSYQDVDNNQIPSMGCSIKWK